MPSLAVVDTNVLVSALMKPDMLPAMVARAVRQGTLMPVLCTEIVKEYAAVLRRPRLGLPAQDTDELLSLLQHQASWVHIRPYPFELNLPDPHDWPFIACALATGCPVITGNLRHFPARPGVAITTVRGWVERTATAQR